MLTRVASNLTLSRFDEPWGETLKSSLLLRPASLIARAVPSFAPAGTLLQAIGYAISIVLFAALPMKQFANDKNGLAVIALAGFISWLLGYLLGGKEKRKPSAMDALVLLYLGANIISTCASHYLAASIHGLAKVLVYVVTYFYLTSVLNTPRRKGLLILVLVGCALFESLYGLYQYKIGVQPLATWEDPTVETKGTRIFGHVGNPNLFAGYLLPIVPLAAAMAAAGLAARKWIFGVPLLGATGIIALATVLTGSRGGYLALFAIIATVAYLIIAGVWTKPKWRIPVIVSLIGCLAVAAFALHYIPAFEQRITSIFAGREHSSNSFRLNVWHSSLKMFKDNWWFGIGPGNQTFVLAYGLYMTSGFDALGTYCVPLEVGVELGLLGMFSVGLLWLSLMARGHMAFWTRSGLSRWVAVGAATALFGMTVHGLVDTVFYRPQVQFIFWLVVALLTTALDDSKPEPTRA